VLLFRLSHDGLAATAGTSANNTNKILSTIRLTDTDFRIFYLLPSLTVFGIIFPQREARLPTIFADMAGLPGLLSAVQPACIFVKRDTNSFSSSAQQIASFYTKIPNQIPRHTEEQVPQWARFLWMGV
jgi:hypothetical protein